MFYSNVIFKVLNIVFLQFTSKGLYKKLLLEYLLNLKFGRARLGAIECFEWKLLPKFTTKHKKIMQNVSNLTIFLDVGAKN
jgi:hypothetical protein